MSILVSCLVPTRGPINGLIKALDSINKTCSEIKRVKILLKVDDDDPSKSDRSRIAEHYGAEVIMGPRRNGYESMGSFIDDMTPHAEGKFSWLFDDDAWLTWDVSKPHWDDQLAAMDTNRMVNSEFYKLGESLYDNNEFGGPPGLIVPTMLAKELRPTKSPVDQTWLDAGLARGWKISLLKGVTYCHEGRPR